MSVYEEYFVKTSARYIPIILIKNHKFNILTQTWSIICEFQTKDILHKRNINEYNNSPIGYNPNPLFWSAEIHKIRKGLIIWVA